MKAYVGVDWSASEVTCSVAVGDGPVRRIKGAKRTHESVAALLQRVRELHAEELEIHVIIEAGTPGWVEMFHDAGAMVHVVDPKQAKAWGESRGSSGAKDDARDADHLVGMGRSPDHVPPVWKPRTELQRQLDVLGTMHETTTTAIGATQQRLRSVLREAFPLLEAELKDLTRHWVLALLRLVPTVWHVGQVEEADVEAALRGAMKTTRAKVRGALATSHAPRLTAGAARIEALHVRQLIAQIELFSQQLTAIEEEVDALTRDLDLRRQLDGVGGIGLKLAHRLIEFAFDEVPETRDQAGIRLGACPVFRGSGKTSRGKPKGKAVMRRAASPRAKSTTYLLGRLASQQLGWAGRMYVDARARGQTAATAYRRIARSLLRILTAVVRTGEPYDDARYVASLKAKGVPWASDPETHAA